MSSRMNLADSSVHPWQFPLLDAPAIPPSSRAAAHSTAPTPAAIPGEAAGSLAAPANGADHDENALAALVEERLALGYAEGVRRGLAEGREQGYAIGLDEGAKAAEAQLVAEARRVAAILDRLAAPIAALERPVEEAVAALALEIARCVIGSEVSHSREYLVRLIREAIAKVPIEMGLPKVLLNPADLELIRALAPEIDDNSAALVADEAVEAGGCLVVADGEGIPVKDRRWYPRAGEGVSQVNLTLSSRWRAVILTLFDGEED